MLLVLNRVSALLLLVYILYFGFQYRLAFWVLRQTPNPKVGKPKPSIICILNNNSDKNPESLIKYIKKF